MNIDNYSDQEIVAALLRRDATVTKEYLYKKCYPLFNAIYTKYYTDCENPLELIDDIYVYILTPLKSTGRSKLDNFEFRCTLAMWLKIVVENYCHQLFARKVIINENIETDSDRFTLENYSIEADFSTLDREDLSRVLLMMPNVRYRQLIEYRYLHGKSNEETAQTMNMTMTNYYNTHLRAKSQFCNILRKEGLI